MITKNKQKIHVVHIIPTLKIGGAEKFVVELCRKVAKENIKQSVVILWDEKPLAFELPKDIDLHVIDFHKHSRLQRFKILAKLLRDINADLIHTHLFNGDLWGRLVAWHLKLPVVTTEHNVSFSEAGWIRFVKVFMRSLSDIYTAPSKAIANFIEKSYKIKPDKVRVIYHGVDTKKFSRIGKAKMTELFRLAIVGRLTEQKGHFVALESLSKIKKVDVKLYITGSGELKAELQTYAEKLKVSDLIVWSEATTEIEKVYENCDILLMPSLWEGLGLVALEAMASERLVIASAVDGLLEIVKENESGYLFPLKDSSKLAEVIENACLDKEKTLLLAKQARNFVIQNFAVEAMAQKYEQLYLDLYHKNYE